MSTIAPDFQQLAELASRLSPGEQLRLVVRISENLSAVLSRAEASKLSPGSAAAILNALREPPQLSNEDMDELEHSIASGRQEVRAEGVFEAVASPSVNRFGRNAPDRVDLFHCSIGEICIALVYPDKASRSLPSSSITYSPSSSLLRA